MQFPRVDDWAEKQAASDAFTSAAIGAKPLQDGRQAANVCSVKVAKSMADMVSTATEGVALEELFGDVYGPTLCGTVISPLDGDRERGRGQGSVLLACTQAGHTAAFIPARMQGAPIVEVHLGPNCNNFVV